MALTQSARITGRSWDEEVVPALRKRLENESRTLARRMSHISMSSNADDNPLAAFNSNSALDPASTSGIQQNSHNMGNGSNGVSANISSGASHWSRPGYPNYHSTPPTDQHVSSAAGTSTPGASTSTSPRITNGVHKPVLDSSFHRSRTYSQPYTSINGGIRQPRRTNTTNIDDAQLGSRSPRLVDAKPTRIPKASRGPTGSTTNASIPTTPFLNGTSSGVSHSTTPTPIQTPNPNSAYVPDIKAYHFPTSHSAQGFSQNTSMRIINEPAPFNTASSANSSIYNIHEDIPSDELGYRPSRDSVDSMEERPFEHWYRGEVSRNGGVGELRVGRRQEMLDIANYGHAINNKRKMLATRQAALLALEDGRRNSMRKRADSVAGFGRLGPGMRERGSLYLEDETILEGIGRVIDEDPLTDIEGDELSDIASISTRGAQDRRPYRYSNHDTDHIPGVGDITLTSINGYSDTSLVSPQNPPTSYEVEAQRDETPTKELSTPTPSAAHISSPPTTPTQSAIVPAPAPPPVPSATPRSKSRQNSTSRIPTYERRSSESRASHHSSSTTRAGQQPNVIDLTNVSPVPSPSPPLPSTSPPMGPTARTGTIPSTPVPATKRGISPGPHNAPGSAAKKPRTPATVAPAKGKAKPKPAIKKIVKKEEDNRRSVAHYPTPGSGDGDEDMADAIPSWTQPKVQPGDGNWDDVVLPVVARKRGLEGYYEKADGSPQPKKKEDGPVAPAPGTFGYDGTKNRRRGTSDEDIEMDEFGQPKPDTSNGTPDVLEEADPEQLLEANKGDDTELSPAHDNIRVPIKPPPSPAPFSHYAPTSTQFIPEIDFAKRRQEQQQQAALEQDDKGAGCCKCVVM